MDPVTAIVIDLPRGAQVLVRIHGAHVPERAVSVDRRPAPSHSWHRVRVFDVRHESTT
jgi:hypothetical protein